MMQFDCFYSSIQSIYMLKMKKSHDLWDIHYLTVLLYLPNCIVYVYLVLMHIGVLLYQMMRCFAEQHSNFPIIPHQSLTS